MYKFKVTTWSQALGVVSTVVTAENEAGARRAIGGTIREVRNLGLEDMRVGGVYLLRGGRVMRYQGPWGGTGPCLAFRFVRDGVEDPPVGLSVDGGDVFQEVTLADEPWLLTRRAQCAARNLMEDVADMDHVLGELRIQ